MNTLSQTETKIKIIPSADRMANGWAAVLIFENGGRQRFSQRFGTMDHALMDAEKMVHIRLKYGAESCVPEPQPNQLLDFSQ